MVKRWLLVSVMLLASLLVVGCGIPQEEYDAVVAERDAAQAQATTLQSDLAKARSDLTAVEAKLASLQEDYNTAKSNLTAVESALAEAEARIAELEAAVEGQLPTMEVGDKWVWSYVMEETTYTLTEEIIGEETVEGRDCYVIDMSFDPVISYTRDDVVSTVTSMKYWGDKATALLGVKMQSSGTYNGTAFTSTQTYSYNPWISLFPLEIGKEIEMEKTTINYYDGEPYGEPVVSTEKYMVVSKEDVTVTAGTFSCWKITYYDSALDTTQTIWWSYQAKTVVKSTDADGNTIMELKSYSVS